MKITVENVAVNLDTTTGFTIENHIFLNGEFQGVIGWFGKLEFETDLVENELLIKSKHKNQKIKFIATKDVKFWIIIDSNAFKSVVPKLYYAGKDLNVIEIN